MEDETAGRRAALPGSTEGPPQGALQREFQISIFHDNLAIFSAHLERHPLQALPAHRCNFPPHCRRSGKRNKPDVPVAHQGRASILPDPVNEIRDPGRNSRLFEELKEFHRGVRRILGRFQDHGVAAQESRKDFPGGDGHGKVPGGNQATHTDRHPERHGEFVGKLRRRGLAKEPPPLTCGIIGGVYPFLHVSARFFQDLAHLACHGTGNFFFALT